MKFIADDGKVFDTMEECEEYEKMNGERQEIARLWFDYVTIYDNEGHITEPVDNPQDSQNFLYEVSEIIADINESAFIHIAPNCPWIKIRNYFYDNYGSLLPDDGEGFWRYDYEHEEWVNFEEEFKNFKENWAPVGIRF